MRRPMLGLALLFLASSAFASGLVKYRNWLDTPEAYFITRAERREFHRLQSDAAAEAFIARYIERRGGDRFKSMVAERTALADRLFNLAPKGSQTMRGKLVVLFGAPQDTLASKPQGKVRGPSGHPLGPVAADRPFGEFMSAPVSQGAPGGGRVYKILTLVFPASASPAFEGQNYEPSFEVDVNTGRDWVAKGTDKKKLQRVMDAAAEASIVRP